MQHFCNPSLPGSPQVLVVFTTFIGTDTLAKWKFMICWQCLSVPQPSNSPPHSSAGWEQARRRPPPRRVTLPRRQTNMPKLALHFVS